MIETDRKEHAAMDEQTRFRTALAALCAAGEQKDQRLAREEVQEFFQDMDLKEEQYEMVYAYLASRRIRVEGVELSAPQAEEQPYTEEEEAFLRQYRKDLRIVRKQPEEKLADLVSRAADGDQEAKKLLIEHCMDRVLPIAENYAHRGLLLQDLVQEGSVGLMTGVDLLGLKEEETDWEEWLEHEIHRAVRAALDEQTGSEDMNGQIVEKLNRLADSIRELTEETGRQLTPEEVSLYLDMSMEELEELLRIAGESVELAESGSREPQSGPR